MSASPLLTIEALHVTYGSGRNATHAVRGVNLEIGHGETLGLVGESGCGKSSLSRAILQLPRPTSGRIIVDGVDLTTLHGERLRRMRPNIQMIFQDPVSSLNPRRKVFDLVTDPLRIWGVGSREEREAAVEKVLQDVGVDPGAARARYPQEYSGGQCQRICIARALVMKPKLLLCDEPVSALDVSIRSQVLNILEDIKVAYGLSILFVAHDLSVVKNVSDRVAVMYRGEILEVAQSDQLYANPQTEYTKKLISAIPSPDPRQRVDPVEVQVEG